MKFEFYRPDIILQPFIDSYCHLSGYLSDEQQVTLMPDCGINLVLNLGEDIQSTRFGRPIAHEGLFLTGPMLLSDVQMLRGEVSLFVVRFKPGAFPYFYKYHSLDQSAGEFHEFEHKDFPDFSRVTREFVTALDQFYLRRLSPPRTSVLEILSTIRNSSVPLRIHELAKNHFITTRQLERLCKVYVGLSPKEIVDLHRFNLAFAQMQSRDNRSLSAIAFDCGYYDHAHLTNDFKRYTEKPPSAFILSDFSKTLVTEPV